MQDRKSRPITQKFKGKSSDQEGYIFDCSDSRQADKYITAIKIIAEYVAAVFVLFPDILCDSLDCSNVFVGLPAVAAVKDVTF